MSFIFKGSDGFGTREMTDMSHSGYCDAADSLLRSYDNGAISKYDRSYDAGKVLEYFGAKDYDELRTKRGW